MLKSLLIFFPLFFLVLALQQPAPVPWSVPPEAARMVNPEKPTPQSRALAKKMYGYDCASCHGASGDGKGELASAVQPPPKDWTNPSALSNITDGELFYIIKNGKDKMPSEGERLNDAGLWNMVILVRSFATK